MASYFIGMHIDLRMRKSLLATVYSTEFNTMALNSKLSKVLSYIQDNKASERIYVLLKIFFLVFKLFVLQISTKQEWKRYSTIPE